MGTAAILISIAIVWFGALLLLARRRAGQWRELANQVDAAISGEAEALKGLNETVEALHQTVSTGLHVQQAKARYPVPTLSSEHGDDDDVVGRQRDDNHKSQGMRLEVWNAVTRELHAAEYPRALHGASEILVTAAGRRWLIVIDSASRPSKESGHGFFSPSGMARAKPVGVLTTARAI